MKARIVLFLAAVVAACPLYARLIVRFHGANDNGFPIGWPDAIQEVGDSRAVPPGWHTNWSQAEYDVYVRDRKPIYDNVRSNYLYWENRPQELARLSVSNWLYRLTDARDNWDLMDVSAKEDLYFESLKANLHLLRYLKNDVSQGGWLQDQPPQRALMSETGTQVLTKGYDEAAIVRGEPTGVWLYFETPGRAFRVYRVQGVHSTFLGVFHTNRIYDANGSHLTSYRITAQE